MRFTEVGKVTLDAGGAGVVALSPAGSDWRITGMSVRSDPPTGHPQCEIFLNILGDAGFVEGTRSGEFDSSDTAMTVPIGSTLYARWTGGTPGAMATIRVTGEV